MATVLHKNISGADAVHPAAFVQPTDPGNVGANLFWIDTSVVPPVMKIRNAANTLWTQFGVGSTGPAGGTGPVGAAGATLVSGAAPYICVQDQKTSGTNAGGATTGAFNTRTLNTLVADTAGLGIILANNQVTLPTGRYRTACKVPAHQVNQHQARLQNITTGTTILFGTSEYASSSGDVANSSVIIGSFSLGSPSVIEVQHRVTSAHTNDGFGTAVSFGTEVYAVAEFWLEGPPPPFMGSTQLTAGQQRHVARGRADHQQHSLNTPPQ